MTFRTFVDICLPSIHHPFFLAVAPVFHWHPPLPHYQYIGLCNSIQGSSGGLVLKHMTQAWPITGPLPSGHSDLKSNGYDQLGCNHIAPPGCWGGYWKDLSWFRLKRRRMWGCRCRSDFVRHHAEEPEDDALLPSKPQTSLWFMQKGPVLHHALHLMIMSLRSFLVWNSFSAFLTFLTLNLLKMTGQLSLECFSTWDFLMFLHS